MSNEDIQLHLLNHEIGHITVFYEFAKILNECRPENAPKCLWERTNLATLVTDAEILNNLILHISFIPNYKERGKDFYETLAEGYAIRARGEDEWMNFVNMHEWQIKNTNNPYLKNQLDGAWYRFNAVLMLYMKSLLILHMMTNLKREGNYFFGKRNSLLNFTSPFTKFQNLRFF